MLGFTTGCYDAIEGTTDSEHVLALLTDRWLALDLDLDDPLARITEALTQTITRLEALRHEHGIEAPSYLNLAMTDGRVAAASRWVSDGAGPPHSLYVALGALRVEDGHGKVVETGDQDEHAVMVASEPLGDRERWEAVPENHLVLIDEARRVRLHPL